MSNSFIVEVVLMSRGTWTSKGFHEKGSGHPEDPLTVSGKPRALKMGVEFARRRCEIYRERGHKARILDTSGRVVLDFDQPLVEPQKFNRETLHKVWTYRGLNFIENRATGLFYHKFKWPLENGPERSISGGSCEEVVERMQAMGGDIPQYVEANLDRVEPTSTRPSIAQPPSVPPLKIEPGYEVVSLRPGSVRP